MLTTSGAVTVVETLPLRMLLPVASPVTLPASIKFVASIVGPLLAIVLSCAPSAAAVWHCDRVRTSRGSNAARRSVFFSVGQGSLLYGHFFTEVLGDSGGSSVMIFCNFSVSFWLLLGSRGPRGPSRDPFWEHGRKRNEKSGSGIDF